MLKQHQTQDFFSCFIFALLAACSSPSASSSRASVEDREAAGKYDFADKFCNQVVDPLQPGSYHFLACQSEAYALVDEGASQKELVERTCRSISSLLTSETGLRDCHVGGQRLIASESFAQAPKDMFKRTALSLVACYEEVGAIQPWYDEEGRCSESSSLSAWNLTTERRTFSELKGFESLDSRQPSVGSYQGKVLFYNEVGRTCTFDLAFTYSGEDITVETQNFECR